MLASSLKSEQGLAALRTRMHWRLLVWAAPVVLLVVLYFEIFVSLARQWWTDPNFSHGFLVPVGAVFFGLRKKGILLGLSRRPTLWGLAILVGSQALLLVGFLGAEYYLQRFSFLLVLVGGILFLYGWAHLRALAFPVSLLLFMIPPPAIIYNTITVPLQFIASRWAEVFLQTCQIPVFREGNILNLAHLTLNITEACSGVRSLVSLLTLAMVFAYFLPTPLWARAFLLFSVLPITLLTNSVRVAGTGLLGHVWGKSAAEGFFHIFSGWLVFLLAFGFLFLESTILERWATSRRR